MMKRILSWLIILCLVFSLLPVTAFATGDTNLNAFSIVGINPLYADVITEADLVKPNRSLLYSGNAKDAQYYNAEAAGAQLRKGLVSRNETIVVNACCASSLETYNADAEDLALDVLTYAMMHTGVPNEGDYLLWHYEGFNANISNGYFQDNILYLTITYTMTYLTTADQEAEMDTAVANLLSDLNVSAADDYDKLKSVYDFICGEITYDYKNTYLLKHTAYAALIKRTAVCQGYATLLYRLALSLGVDCRLIAGKSNGDNHGWNIAEIDGVYYNLDSTWDAGKFPYLFFLVSPDNFTDHSRFEEYDTASFHANYPMAKTDYVAGEQEAMASGACGENLTWTLNEVGTLTISGTGAMYEYDSSSKVPWGSYNGQITEVEIKEGATTISPFAFDGCKALTDIALPSTLTVIGSYAFRDCDAFTKIELPGKLQKIDGSAFHSCDALTSLTIPASVTELGSPLAENSKKLETITFSGDAPKLGENTFRTGGTKLTVHYPAGKTTWDSVKGKNYGFAGTVEWIAECPGHKWNAATCTTPKTCAICGATEGTAKGHNYIQKVTAPSCTEKGYTTYTCSCGDSYIGNYVDETGHSYASKVTAPTCTEQGYTTYTCSCGDTYKDNYVDKTGHSYASKVTAPTCTAKGYTTYTCHCGDTYTTNAVKALGHNEVADKGYAATCTKEGLTDGTHCDRCNTVLLAQTAIAATGHSWDAGVVTTQPTENKTGIRTYTCGTCGDTKTEVISALGHTHNYSSVITEPSCTEGGYTTHTCACGNIYIDNETSAAGHRYVNGICSACGTTDPNYSPEEELFELYGANMILGNNLAMNFYIETADIEAGEDYYAVITKENANGEDLVITIQDEDWQKYSDKYYRITLEQIAAKEMTDEVTVVIYNDEGEAVSKAWEDSVRKYAMRMLKNEEAKEAPNAEQLALYVEILNYGAAAQEHFKYNASDLANNQLTEAQKAYGIANVEMKDTRVKGEGYYGTSLTLESNILMNFYFNNIPAEHADMYAIASFTDHYGKAQQIKIEGEELEKFDSTTWKIAVAGLAVADCRQQVEVKVYDASGAVIASVADSIESYTARKNGDGPLFIAIMKFAVAAYNSFH